MPTDDNVVKLVTDEQFAEDVKRRLNDALIPVFVLFEEAHRRGMIVQWDGLGVGSFGKAAVTGLRLVKSF